MSTFGYYFLFLTFGLGIYYLVVFFLDITRKDGGKRDDSEEIDVSDSDDLEESPVQVNVSENGFSFGEQEDTDSVVSEQESSGDVEESPGLDKGMGDEDGVNVFSDPDQESDLVDAVEDETVFNDDADTDISDEQLERLRQQLADEMEPSCAEYQSVFDSTEFHVVMRQPRSNRTGVLRTFGGF